MREAEDSRLGLSLVLWFPRYGRQAPRFPCSRQAGGVRSHLESPGKSMGEAAAPGSPWGIPGCSLGWGGSGGAGSEGQPLPWGSALHGPPKAPGSPQAGALGRKRAPPAGRPERVSSRCRRPKSVDHPRPDWHFPGEPGLQRPQFSHGPEPPGGAFVPLESALRSPGISWDPGPGRLTFCRIPLHSSSTASEWPRTQKQYSHTPTAPPAPPDPLHWIPVERILQRGSSNQTPRGSSSPCKFGLRKAPLRQGQPELEHHELSPDPRGSTVKQIPPSLQSREVPPTDPILHPSPAPRPVLSPAQDQMVQMFPSLPPPALSPAARCPPPRAAHRRLPRIPGLRRLPPPAPLKPALPSTVQPPRAFFSEPSGAAQSPIPVFRGGEKLSEATWQPSSLGARSQIGHRRHYS